jgi:hypothetical protein
MPNDECRINDEARMTKETIADGGCGLKCCDVPHQSAIQDPQSFIHSSFGLRHSSLIRHSDFGIRHSLLRSAPGMETTLHRQLKELYCGDARAREVRVAGFRIDAVVAGELIEIQQASLAALRRKVATLLEQHRVTIVKPLAAQKLLLRRERRGGAIVSRRASPRHATLLDLFVELVHFVDVFPHPRLTLEVMLTEQEETRIAITRRRRWGKDYRVDDRRLLQVLSQHRLRTAGDLAALLPAGLAEPFSTADLARRCGIPRWLAQKMAYCLRRTGAVACLGKRGNSWLYATKQDQRRVA